MKIKVLLFSLIIVTMYACSPHINTFGNINQDVFWENKYNLKDNTKSVYYVDSIPVPENYTILYSLNSRYAYITMDSIDVDTITESTILSNNIASLEMPNISYEMSLLDDSITKSLYGNDNIVFPRGISQKKGKNNICKFVYDKSPSYYRVLLIKGDYLNWRIFYSKQDGRYGKMPIQIIDPYAYYKVYVPIWL